MPAETYFCPHCKRQIKKSAQAYVMGESLTTKGAHFVALGGVRDIVPCPSCGGEIDNMKMMLGEYDARPGGSGGGGRVAFFVIAGLIAIAVYFIWFR